MTPPDWQALHAELTRCTWFANVGAPIDAPAVRRVATWAKASGWAKADITW